MRYNFITLHVNIGRPGPPGQQYNDIKSPLHTNLTVDPGTIWTIFISLYETDIWFIAGMMYKWENRQYLSVG